MTLSNDVQTAIQKELPNMVAQELQDYIKQAEKLKADYDTLKSNFEAGSWDNQALKKQLEELSALKNSAASLGR